MAKEKQLSRWATLPYPLTQTPELSAAAPLRTFNAAQATAPTLAAATTSTEQHASMPQANGLAPASAQAAAVAGAPAPPLRVKDAKWLALLASRAVGTRRSSRGGQKLAESEDVTEAPPPLVHQAAEQHATSSSKGPQVGAEAAVGRSPAEVTQAVPPAAGCDLQSSLAAAHVPATAAAPVPQTAAADTGSVLSSATAAPIPTVIEPTAGHTSSLRRVPVKAGNGLHGVPSIISTAITGPVSPVLVSSLSAPTGVSPPPSPGPTAPNGVTAGRRSKRKLSAQPLRNSVDDDWAELELMEKSKGRGSTRGPRPGGGLDTSRMALGQGEGAVALADMAWEVAAGGWERPACGTAYVSHAWGWDRVGQKVRHESGCESMQGRCPSAFVPLIHISYLHLHGLVVPWRGNWAFPVLNIRC